MALDIMVEDLMDQHGADLTGNKFFYTRKIV